MLLDEPQYTELLPDETPLEKATREFLTGCPFCGQTWKAHFARGGVYVDCGGEDDV